MTRKLYLRTFGCQMNEYDSHRMADLLADTEGAALTDDPAEADIVLFNTCSVREKAQEKVFSDLGRFKALKRERPDLKGKTSAQSLTSNFGTTRTMPLAERTRWKCMPASCADTDPSSKAYFFIEAISLGKLRLVTTLTPGRLHASSSGHPGLA